MRRRERDKKARTQPVTGDRSRESLWVRVKSKKGAKGVGQRNRKVKRKECAKG